MKCLIANIGVTSFKYRVLEMPEEAKGHMERIGQPGGVYADYPSAIRKCLAEIAGEGVLA
jgi:acetate kinase